MELGQQIIVIVAIVVGFVGVVVYQRWKKTSRTQADLDARRSEDEAPE